MEQEQVEKALLRMSRRLGLEELSEEESLLLEDELLAAMGEILLYLNTGTLEEAFWPKAEELALLFYRRDRQEQHSGGLRSSSYAEGQISQSEQYLTPAEFRSGVAEVLESLARFRRVSC